LILQYKDYLVKYSCDSLTLLITYIL
jgi:hypothetical protein